MSSLLKQHHVFLLHIPTIQHIEALANFNSLASGTKDVAKGAEGRRIDNLGLGAGSRVIGYNGARGGGSDFGLGCVVLGRVAEGGGVRAGGAVGMNRFWGRGGGFVGFGGVGGGGHCGFLEMKNCGQYVFKAWGSVLFLFCCDGRTGESGWFI